MTIPNEQQRAEAHAYFQQSVKRAKVASNPPEQKFPKGTRVFIAADLEEAMFHFECNQPATVLYTYWQAFGGDVIKDSKSYCLQLDDGNEISWYYEHQLTAI